MEKLVVAMIVLIMELHLSCFISCSSWDNYGRSSVKNSDVDTMLKLLNKPALKSIKSEEDGDIIDCVDIHKQPAFDHPALKNHKIQMRPSNSLSRVRKQKNGSAEEDSRRAEILQTWQRSGRCPAGTVAIRRIKREELLRGGNSAGFGKKRAAASTNNTSNLSSRLININTTKLGPQTNRSTAIVVTVGYNYIGAKGDINVWNPPYVQQEDYTTAQIWLKAGPGDAFESLEAGWTVNPKLYGDGRTRLFGYWTKDAYKSTGCFDLTCSGFVQTSHNVVLGASIDKMSTEGGPQFKIRVEINMDPETSNWWLIVQDVGVGYWPASGLLDYLKHSATLVEWGGEVYSQNVKKSPHTRTPMGSGNFADGLFGVACFINQIRIIDYSLQLKYPEHVSIYGDEFYCYSAQNYQSSLAMEPFFYFGGPGYHPPYCA